MAACQEKTKGLLNIVALFLHSWQKFQKEITERNIVTYCYTAAEFLVRGERKDGKALNNFLSVCLHTSLPSLHKQPPKGGVNQPFYKALTNAATCPFVCVN